MNVIAKLASSLGRRDEAPNMELAKEIANNNDKKAVKELVENLHSKNKNIQNDCIKVLYEIGEHKPSLVKDYAKEFILLLDNKNNRLQWGAMTALYTITSENAELIYTALPKIIDIANKGSVITKDYCVNILIKLCSLKQYTDSASLFLIEQLLSSPTNQLPMYAERTLPVINEKNKAAFVQTLSIRLPEIDKDSKRARLEKVIKKMK